jgi:hypothetical protein
MQYYITAEFEGIIGASRLESLNSHPSAVYGLDSKFYIVYQNPASLNFSEQNNNSHVSVESSLGKNIFDIIPEALATAYKELFTSVLNDKSTLMISRQFEYECSSPELYRSFSMHIYPLGKDGLLIVHSLLVEEPYISLLGEVANIVDEDNYIDKNGIVTQCANCRRIKNLSNEGQWDWITKWVKEAHKPTSHGICKPCMQHYYLHSWDQHNS